MKHLKLLAIAACTMLAASCSNDDWESPNATRNDNTATFRLKCQPYDGIGTRAADDDTQDARYDQVAYYIAYPDGRLVTNMRVAYNPATAEISVEGLHEGDYQLLVLGVKGNAADDQATIHTLTRASDTWLSFPEDLQRPLQAEYFYSRTPFSVTVTDAGSGREEVAHIQQTIVQRRIIGRADFSFSYNNPYVRTAVSSNKVHWQGGRFYTSFAADSVFAGSSDGVIREEDLLRSSSCMFMPTREDEALEGNIELRTRSYEGEGQKQTYGFEQISIRPNHITNIGTHVSHPDDNLGTLFVTTMAYDEGNYAKILQDDEPKTVYADSKQRSFHTGRTLQTKFTDNGQLHVRFYSPRSVSRMKIMTRIPAVSNEFFDLAYFDSIPAFADFYNDVPFSSRAATYRTESGKIIQIPPMRPELLTDAEFKLVSDDEYWAKLQKIKHGWNISFGLYGGDPDLPDGGPNGNWMGIRPVHCREAVAVLINFTYMIDMPEHEQILADNVDKLYDDNKNPVTPERVLQQMRIERTLIVGLVYPGNGVLGLGGGSTWGVYQQAYLQHYTNAYSCNLMFHELGHVMGYGHSSAFTYGPWAEQLMNNFYVNNLNKFPIDSSKYLNSSQNPTLYK